MAKCKDCKVVWFGVGIDGRCSQCALISNLKSRLECKTQELDALQKELQGVKAERDGYLADFETAVNKVHDWQLWCKDLKQENEKYRKALEYYADLKSNLEDDFSDVFICDSGPFRASGKRARQALEEGE